MGNGNNQYTIRRMVQTAKDGMGALMMSMPSLPTTRGQRRLLRKHGSPKAFARGCIAALGEISVDEATAAILKYRYEWDAA